MDVNDLIAPPYRKAGRSCENCQDLIYEWDSSSNEKGAWICICNPDYSEFEEFPFKKEMPCFKLDFSFTIFAQNLPRTEASYEAALGKFTETLSQLTRAAVNPGAAISPEIQSGVNI